MSDVGLYSLDADNTLVFSLKNLSRRIEGPEQAVQIVAKALFNQQGSDIFARSSGVDLRKTLKGRNIGDLRSARADVLVDIGQAWQTVKRNQSRFRADNETITGIELIDLSVDDQKWLVKIRINLANGNSFAIGIPG